MDVEEQSMLHLLKKSFDFKCDPGIALRPDGFYKVLVISKNSEPDNPYQKVVSKTETVKLKRENLELIDACPQTALSNSELRQVGMTTTAEIEAMDPGTAGLFPAIGHGDHVRVKQIVEHIQKTRQTDNAADWILDGAGCTALSGAVTGKHLELVKVLLNYGADPNAPWGILNPMHRELDMSILQLAISMLKQLDPSIHIGKEIEDIESIIDLLLENGADVKKCSKSKGTALDILISLEITDFDATLRIMRKLIDNGADPNFESPVFVNDICKASRLPIVDAVSMKYNGAAGDINQVVELLLEHGADPGKLCMRGNEYVNAIIMASNHRRARMLEVFLKTEKGRNAVNVKHIIDTVYNGESALLMTIPEDRFGKKEDTILREIAVILLKYGADVDQKRNDGCSAMDWLNTPSTSSDVNNELKKLLKNAPDNVRSKRQETLDYWDIDKNDKVKAFVGTGSDGRQCPVCLVWSYQMRNFLGGKSSNFMQCSRCKKQWYCSRKCQKQHWKYHKPVCKEVT
jgi:ankyrin repeat protein